MTSLHDFSLKTIDGEALPLASFAGKAVLVVNVASKCGLTPQYDGLEKLHEELAAKGLVVLGVPCNDFGGQEPGTEADVKAFCTTNYGVKFPMASKIAVLGDKKDALYAWLTTNASTAGDITWNFEKFLVGKDGAIVARFSPKTAPNDPALRAAIDKALA
jgi:glutathione peroxidase